MQSRLLARSNDALIGPIKASDSAMASRRISIIYADRLAHFRASALGGSQ